MRNNVTQVLVLDGTTTTFTKDQGLSVLKTGQLGFFDYEKNQTVDATNADELKDFYLAVGLGTTGQTAKSIRRSAGQKIKKSLITSYEEKAPVTATPMVVEITKFDASPNTDYAIRLDFVNEEILRTQGYNQFSKTYGVRTPCENSCKDCLSGDCNELVKLLVESINNDKDNLVKAEAFEIVTTTTGSGSSETTITTKNIISDIQDFIDTNKTVNTDKESTNDVCLNIRLTTKPLSLENYASINLKYYHPRQTTITCSLTQGFDCNGKVTVTQDGSYEQGHGYDIRQLEYNAGGWNGEPGPYRVLQQTGTAKQNIVYTADLTKKYTQFALSYDLATSGYSEDFINQTTIIAIPSTSTTLITNFKEVMKKIVS